MNIQKIGIASNSNSVNETVLEIKKLDELGIHATWLTTGGTAPDAVTIFAAAASRTNNILLGTSIIPTWPRHPVTAVQQIQVLDQIAPGRFRFGVGPSHKEPMQKIFNADFKAPITHLREYLTVVRTLLNEGSIKFEGRYFQVQADIPAMHSFVPVMASALRPASFELCGELSDGAISWLCPLTYLRDVALPALENGAAKAGRSAPPLIAHVALCVCDDIERAITAFKKQFNRYASIPFYQSMLEFSGFPEAAEGNLSHAMVDSVLIAGNELSVEKKLQGILEYGFAELLISIVEIDGKNPESRERTLSFIRSVSLGALEN